ncbi:MAG: winged helix-turn-helix domain-containing protein [Gemmatimonadota bacterium]
MTATPHDAPSVRFGPFAIDGRTLELRCGARLLPLEPLPARILLCLAERQGTMVSRRELLELGWPRLPGAAEQSLNTCVHQIRQALSTEAAGAVQLETLRGRGYRLRVGGAGPTPARRFGHRQLAYGGGVALALAMVAAALLVRGAGSTAEHRSVEQTLERARYLAQETHDRRAARAVLDSARIRYPREPSILAEWAELSIYAGDLEAAADAVSRALALDRDHPVAHRARGLLAMRRWDWRAADVALERALALAPNDPRTLSTLAYWRVTQGRPHAADTLIQQALAVDPLAAFLYEDAGLIYLLSGDLEQAERYCTETLRFQPDSEWATDCLFDVMVLAGRTEGGSLGPAPVRAAGGPRPRAARDVAFSGGGGCGSMAARSLGGRGGPGASPSAWHWPTWPRDARRRRWCPPSGRGPARFRRADRRLRPSSRPLRDQPAFRQLLDQVERGARSTDSSAGPTRRS